VSEQREGEWRVREWKRESGSEWREGVSGERVASERSQRVSGAREGVERVCVWRERVREERREKRGLTRVPMPPTPDSRAARCEEKVLPTPDKAQSTDA